MLSQEKVLPPEGERRAGMVQSEETGMIDPLPTARNPALPIGPLLFSTGGVDGWVGAPGDRRGVVNEKVTPEGPSQSSGPRVMRRWRWVFHLGDTIGANAEQLQLFQEPAVISGVPGPLGRR